MKLVTFAVATALGVYARLGALLDADADGRIVDLTAAYRAYLEHETDEPTPEALAHLRTPPDMIGWLRGAHASRAAAEQALTFVRARAGAGVDLRGRRGERLVFARDGVRLLAPLPRPNSFRDGNPDAILGPEDPIPLPADASTLDLEAKIGIVIGRTGRNLRLEQARDAIAGYTIVIDAGGATAVGPCLVTADELDAASLNVPPTFGAYHLVAHASAKQTLFPGDLFGIATTRGDGHTAVQVGATVELAVAGIGRMRHQIVAGEPRA